MSYRKRHTYSKIKSLRPKKNIIRRPAFWIALFSAFLLCTTSYLILFFPGFHISRIEVSGYEKMSSQDMENIAWEYLNKSLIGSESVGIPLKSIFIANTTKIREIVYKKFPIIEEVSIQKDLPNILHITIKERKPVAIFCSDFGDNYWLIGGNDSDFCYLIDRNGVIFEEVQNVTEEYTVLRHGTNDIEVALGGEVVSKNTIDIVRKIEHNLEDNFQITAVKFTISNPLIVQTNESWDIYFDVNSDIDLQITKMNSLLEGEITQDVRKELQYIYLQYKDRAYYK